MTVRTSLTRCASVGSEALALACAAVAGAGVRALGHGVGLGGAGGQVRHGLATRTRACDSEDSGRWCTYACM